MDLSSIPRTFWHAVSVAVLVVAVGLTLIAYGSANVSIDFANKTVQLSAAREDLIAAIREAEELNAELERENQRLKRMEQELRRKVAELENRIDRVLVSRPVEAAELKRELRKIETDLSATTPVTIPEDRFKEVYEKLDRTRQQIQVQQTAPQQR